MIDTSASISRKGKLTTSSGLRELQFVQVIVIVIIMQSFRELFNLCIVMFRRRKRVPVEGSTDPVQMTANLRTMTMWNLKIPFPAVTTKL